ncbi:MAG: hypothetical protein ACRCWR_03165, partial [Saezia sp.]
GASISCPRCNGTGHIRDTESTSLQILRRIQEEALKGDTAVIKIQVPVDVASYLLNKKREELTKIEMNNDINVLLIPNKQLETPNYLFERLKEDNPQLENLHNAYALNEKIEDSDVAISKPEQKISRQEPVIKSYMPATAPAAAPAPAPTPVPVPAKEQQKKHDAPLKVQKKTEASSGFFGWLKNLFAPASDNNAKNDDEKRQDRNNNNNNRRKSSSKDSRDERRPQEHRKDAQDNNRNRRAPNKTDERKNDRPERQDRQERPDRQNRNNENRGEESRNNDNNRQRNSRPARQQTENDSTAVEAKQTRAPQQRRGRQKPEQTEEQQVANATVASSAAQADVPHENVRPNNLPAHKIAENTDTAVTSETSATAGSEDEQNGRRTRSRRTRDRYGRDRRQRNGRNDEQTDGIAPSAEVDTATSSAVAVAALISDTMDATPQKATPPKADIAEKASSSVMPEQETAQMKAPSVMPVQEKLVFDAALEVQTTEKIQKKPPVPKEKKVKPVASLVESNAAYALPANDLESVAKNAGLEWVSTNSALIKEAQESIKNEPKPAMGRTMKSHADKNESEALVMVETQKTLPADK